MKDCQTVEVFIVFMKAITYNLIMPIFLGLILGLAVGYFFGSFVLVLFGVLIIALPLYVIAKSFTKTYLVPYFKKRRERKKLRNILKERLSYLP